MPKTTPARRNRRPVLFVTVGRQRVGKTTLENLVIQALRERGANLQIWNADQLNVTYSLSLFHPDVLHPPSTDFEDVKAWLEERIQDQMEGQYDALLDVGGGETALSRLVQEIPIVQTMESHGIRVVLVHVIGPEQADVDYLQHFMRHELFTPEATLIVLNGGLILSGRSIGNAFADIFAHPVIAEAESKGAVVAIMPALSCMSKVTDRGLTFLEAAEGTTKGKHTRLSFFDQERVSIWWRKAVPAFLATIPTHWLPAISGEPFAQPVAEPIKSEDALEKVAHD